MVYLSLLLIAAGIGMGINMTCQCVGGHYLAWFIKWAGRCGSQNQDWLGEEAPVFGWRRAAIR